MDHIWTTHDDENKIGSASKVSLIIISYAYVDMWESINLSIITYNGRTRDNNQSSARRPNKYVCLRKSIYRFSFIAV